VSATLVLDSLSILLPRWSLKGVSPLVYINPIEMVGYWWRGYSSPHPEGLWRNIVILSVLVVLITDTYPIVWNISTILPLRPFDDMVNVFSVTTTPRDDTRVIISLSTLLSESVALFTVRHC
jgi:hypothetical protein